MLSVTILLVSLPLAHAKVADPCNGVDLATFPEDGSTDVAPESLPALLVGDCGGGEITATLAVNGGEPLTTTLDADNGVYWLDFPLAPDADVQLDVERWGNTSRASFQTGHTPLVDVVGRPALFITGSELSGSHRGSRLYTVGLETGLLPDPSGAVYELRRDAEVSQVGVDDALDEEG